MSKLTKNQKIAEAKVDFGKWTSGNSTGFWKHAGW